MKQVLPADLAQRLRGLYAQRVPGRPSNHVSGEFLAAVVAARTCGWSLGAIADAVGVCRQSIHRFSNLPPARPSGPTLNLEQIDELRNLKRRANVRGGMAVNDPRVQAGYELARLLNGYLIAGHRMKELASVLGVTKDAVRWRLGRYGFRLLPPSVQRDYGPTTTIRQQANGLP